MIPPINRTAPVSPIPAITALQTMLAKAMDRDAQRRDAQRRNQCHGRPLPAPLPAVSPKAGEGYPEGQGCPSQRNGSDPYSTVGDPVESFPRRVRDGHSTPVPAPVDMLDISEAGESRSWADEDPLW